MKTVKQIQNKINSLMIKLSKKPLKENFGQKEIRELQDYVGCIHDYGWPEKPEILNLEKDFIEWCASGRGL